MSSLFVHPGKKIGGWVFRYSIFENSSIMVMAFCCEEPADMILRFFTASTAANHFVWEIAARKPSS